MEKESDRKLLFLANSFLKRFNRVVRSVINSTNLKLFTKYTCTAGYWKLRNNSALGKPLEVEKKVSSHPLPLSTTFLQGPPVPQGINYAGSS